MTRYNVLILPIGTEIGLEIYRALRYSKHFHTFGISSDDNNHGRFLCGENYTKENVPTFNDEAFWDKLSIIINRYEIDFIYPASPLLFDVLHLNLNDKIKEKIILPNFETVTICRSKKLTYLTFESNLKVPLLSEKESRHLTSEDYPIFLKPERGQGTSNCHVVKNKDELGIFSRLVEDPLLLKYIEGPEYTVDCFTDKHGKLRFVGARIRNRIKNGISVNTVSVDNERFKIIADKINSVLEMRGGWFFQVKGNDELYLLEIEPRIAGTSGTWRQVGVNLPLLTLYDKIGHDVEIQINDCSIELDRALKARFKTNLKYNNVYVDLDDTLILNNKVNTELVAFLYQCKNEKKRLFLITKNAFAINQLRKYCIDSALFDEIIISDNKKDSMKNFPAIFIDDSFGERQEVSKIGVPVFDLDAIECLRRG